MNIPEFDRVIYKCNPLIEVICQLRFPPILKISHQEPVDFQDEIRTQYPLFQTTRTQIPSELSKIVEQFDLPPLQSDIAYNFKSEDQRWNLSLTKDFIALSTSSYERYEQYKERFCTILDIFDRIYKPSFYSRLGLRYKDLIIRSNLGLENLDWSKLITKRFASELHNEELSSSIQGMEKKFIIRNDDMQVNLNHVLVTIKESQDSNEETAYLIDADFFSEQKVEGNNNAWNVLDQYNRSAGGFLDGVSQMYSMKPYNPNPLKQNKFEQTSSGVSLNNIVLDRESGKTYIIDYPSFGLAVSGSSLSVRLDRPDLSRDNLIQLAKCLIILQFLPKDAFEETTDKLEGIYRLYKNRQSQIGLSKPPVNKIKKQQAILQIIKKCASLPTLDTRTPDEILGYDDDAMGLWGGQLTVVVDSSVLIAILLSEPEAEDFANRLIATDEIYLSAVSILESAIVIESKKDEEGASQFDALLAEITPTVVAFDSHQAELARAAWQQYGKGRHPAKLNFGDCCCYAVAKYLNKPLLFKGNDFSKTDLEQA